MSYSPAKTRCVRTLGEAQKQHQSDTFWHYVGFAIAFTIIIAGTIGILAIVGRSSPEKGVKVVGR